MLTSKDISISGDYLIVMFEEFDGNTPSSLTKGHAKAFHKSTFYLSLNGTDQISRGTAVDTLMEIRVLFMGGHATIVRVADVSVLQFNTWLAELST